MATQPTNLPVPSESPRDLKFNAGKIDEFVTSISQNYIDRFGQAHYTIEGLKQLVINHIYDLGWNPIGSFQDGVTVDSAGDIVQDEENGVWYRWDDLTSLPKTVPAGSTPESTGGIGNGKWLAVDVTGLLKDELAQEDGAKYSLSQVATAYGLDFSLGDIWAPGRTSNPDKWWWYNNKVYRSFGITTLSTEPNFDEYYVLSPNGTFSNEQFGMELSETSTNKLTLISNVIVYNKEKLTFCSDCTIVLDSDFVWLFNYCVKDGVIISVNSDGVSRDIRIERSDFKLHKLNLGDNVNIRVTTSSGILRRITIEDNILTSGGISCVGDNRGYGLIIKGNSIKNNSGSVSNGIQIGDWCDVDVSNNTGGRFVNAFIFINPAFSYTSFNITLTKNSAQQCKQFGIAFAGAAEIGVINNFRIIGNTITCPVSGSTRAIVLQNAHGGVIDGNTLTANIHTAADGSNDVRFINNSLNFNGSVGLRCRGCAGWSVENNTSHANSSSVYHVEFSSQTTLPNRGVAGRSFFSGNTYNGGSRGILLTSGIFYSVGQETFISPTGDSSVGVVNVSSGAFNSTIEGDQRSIKPISNPVVTNSSINSVVDGPAVHPTGASTITAIVNGDVVSSLHGKVYHFTVDLNNNIENFQSAMSIGQGKVVSDWASTVPGAKLAINASPFLVATGDYRIQDSYINGSPTPYTDKSNLTGINAGCVIHKNGTMQVRYRPNSQADTERMLEPQTGDYVWQSAFFSIPLIINGAISNLGADPAQNPRTAIGQTANGLLHVIVVDGRNADSAGCTTNELATYLLGQGCVTAFNLDGGGSSTIWYNGNVINNPSDGAQRVVAQAWVFK